MQQAIPYRTWPSLNKENKLLHLSSTSDSKEESVSDRAKEMVKENAVLVFGKQGCCMCHAMKQLLSAIGVNPVVCEVVDQLEMNELAVMIGAQLPSVYIGGKLFGGLNRLIAAHISGELVPVLKQAGALWL